MARSFAAGINPDALKRAGIKPRESKYGNKRTEYNGRTYDSALEAAAAQRLDLLQAAGRVTHWERQVVFDLGAGVTYKADFVVRYVEGATRTIDMKGAETDVFKLKRKFFEALYGPLDVIKRVDDLPSEGHETTHSILTALSPRYAGTERRKP